MPSPSRPLSRTSGLLAGLVVAGAGLAAVPSAADAAQILVTTGREAAADGRCSLREALRAADTDLPVDACPAGAGADVVVLPRGLDVLVQRGPLEIRSAVTLRGDGGTSTDPVAVVRQDATSPDHHDVPLVHVTAGGVATLRALALADAGYSALVNDGELTAVAVTVRDGRQGLDLLAPAGAALTNRGRATLAGATVTGNQHRDAVVRNEAGAALTVTGSTFSSNPGEFGAEVTVANAGTLTASDSRLPGGVTTTGSATLTRVQLSGRPGLSNGGTARLELSTVADGELGIHNSGRLTVDHTAVRGNTGVHGVEDGAGGIVNSGSLRLQHSAVTGNSARGTGGIRSTGTLWMSDTTVAANMQLSSTTADLADERNPAGAGGVTVAAGSARLTGVTLARNAYRSDPYLPAAASASGGLNNTGGTVTLADTVLGQNTSDQSASSQDCAGTLTSGGYNLVHRATGCAFTRGIGDRTGLDPRLGVLANNGGRTPTLLPQAGSPLVDSGSPTVPGSTTAGACTARDQRGVTRPRDGNGDGSTRCDIGAAERRSTTTG